MFKETINSTKEEIGLAKLRVRSRFPRPAPDKKLIQSLRAYREKKAKQHSPDEFYEDSFYSHAISEGLSDEKKAKLIVLHLLSLLFESLGIPSVKIYIILLDNISQQIAGIYMKGYDFKYQELKELQERSIQHAPDEIARQRYKREKDQFEKISKRLLSLLKQGAEDPYERFSQTIVDLVQKVHIEGLVSPYGALSIMPSHPVHGPRSVIQASVVVEPDEDTIKALELDSQIYDPNKQTPYIWIVYSMQQATTPQENQAIVGASDPSEKTIMETIKNIKFKNLHQTLEQIKNRGKKFPIINRFTTFDPDEILRLYGKKVEQLGLFWMQVLEIGIKTPEKKEILRYIFETYILPALYNFSDINQRKKTKIINTLEVSRSLSEFKKHMKRERLSLSIDDLLKIFLLDFSFLGRVPKFSSLMPCPYIPRFNSNTISSNFRVSPTGLPHWDTNFSNTLSQENPYKEAQEFFNLMNTAPKSNNTPSKNPQKLKQGRENPNSFDQNKTVGLEFFFYSQS